MANSSPPLISVIVPAYNCEHFLPITLDSIIAQTETEWECIIVDDGSTDGTVNVAQRYVESDRRFKVLAQTNCGPSAARNAGFRGSNCGAKYVTFMDGDDVWLPHALEALRHEIERQPESIGAHGLGEFINADGYPMLPGVWAQAGRNRLGYNGKRLVKWDAKLPTTFRVLINGNVLFPPGLVLTQRWVYERSGLFDETLGGAEDWDMLIRLSRYGAFAFLNDVILHYRRHSSNLGAANGIETLAWRVRCKAFFSPENSAEQQDIAKRGWRAYQVYMMHERVRAAKECAKSGKILSGAKSIVSIPLHVGRYLLGYPTLRGEYPPKSLNRPLLTQLLSRRVSSRRVPR